MSMALHNSQIVGRTSFYSAYTGILFGFTLLLASCIKPDPLAAYLATLPDEVQVSFQVGTPDAVSVAGQEWEKQVPSASIIKVPILIAFMQDVQEGKRSLSEEIVLEESDRVGGAGELQFQTPGSTYTLELLAREMIRISDNTATNLLIQTVGMERIRDWLRQHGFRHTQLNRLMMDFGAIAEGRQNYTSAEEMVRMLLELFAGKYLDPAGTSFVLELLTDCADRDAMPSKLPIGTAVAHKTGTLDYVRGDAGLLLGENPLALCVFVEGFSSLEQADEIIGNISRLVFDIFGQ
ncbi:MAG: serine hydrolase [Lunatimonas sp.]|uniref:serine hydrolase n=1 Tax=Lunatimonas sp. TaxID=2060141 RepID=UPI00263B2DC1|nr:serine hydrolase [Lunatimonas sp.]MCC5938307.1 serine hydrolase [Lunatimonas sp.]